MDYHCFSSNGRFVQVNTIGPRLVNPKYLLNEQNLNSPLTANSYFPAIQALADAFHVSVELINVTITVYMVLQGICAYTYIYSLTSVLQSKKYGRINTAPMLWGTLSDRIGRRPLFITCLLLLCIACVGLALVPTDAYWLLLLLRCFQAAGSASTIAIGRPSVQ